MTHHSSVSGLERNERVPILSMARSQRTTRNHPSMSEGVFYKLDSTRVTFRELRYEGNLLKAGFGALLLKVFRMKITGSTDDPPVQSLEPFEVTELPEEIRQRFDLLAAELAHLGFEGRLLHAIDDSFHWTRTYLASFRDTAQRAVARIHHRIWTKVHPA